MTTETKHTPGPWTAVAHQYQDDEGMTETRWEIQAQDGTTVIESVWGETSVIAQRNDAHLVAASPDVYTALKEARSFVEDVRRLRREVLSHFGATMNHDDIDDCLRRIDAALAKAEGKS